MTRSVDVTHFLGGTGMKGYKLLEFRLFRMEYTLDAAEELR